MRLFLAINLPVELRHDMSVAAVSLRECAPGLSWVDAARLHLTLKFLGEQPDERAEEIQATTAMVAAAHRDMAMTVGGVGAFPNFRRARVVWMAVEQDPRLELLHHDLEVAFERMGFEVEGRPFRPHITLARVRTPMPDEQARRLAKASRKIEYRGECFVRTIDLMRSDLLPRGPAHTTLLSAALRSD